MRVALGFHRCFGKPSLPAPDRCPGRRRAAGGRVAKVVPVTLYLRMIDWTWASTHKHRSRNRGSGLHPLRHSLRDGDAKKSTDRAGHGSGPMRQTKVLSEPGCNASGKASKESREDFLHVKINLSDVKDELLRLEIGIRTATTTFRHGSLWRGAISAFASVCYSAHIHQSVGRM